MWSLDLMNACLLTALSQILYEEPDMAIREAELSRKEALLRVEEGEEDEHDDRTTED